MYANDILKISAANLRLGVTLVTLQYFLVSYPVAFAQVEKSLGDFDAETIATIKKENTDSTNVISALPVDLVEEQAPAALPGGNKDAAPTQSGGNEVGQIYTDDEGNELPSSIDSKTLLNVKDAEIATLINAFSKITKRNYIVDSNVRGKVTIHLPSHVSSVEALKIFDAVLLIKGFTTVPVGKNTWKVVATKDAKQTTVPLQSDGAEQSTDAVVTQFIRLKFVKAEDLQQILTQFISPDGLINAFAGTNALILIDSAANIERLTKIIKELDVPAVDQDITIIPIVHAEANDIAEKITEILGKEEESAQQPRVVPVSRRTPQQQTGSPFSQPNQGGQGGTPTRPALPHKVIPDQRTNSLIVVADPETTAKIRAVVERLDSPVDLSGGRFYVYRLKHADAEELAGILGDLISGAQATSADRPSREGSSLTRSQQRRRNTEDSSRQQALQALQRQNLSRTAGNTTNASGAPGRVNFEGEVSVASDPSTNSLIINASRTDYNRLKEIIDELDVKRRQVIVEATILEVSLNKEEGMGIELQGSAATDDGGVIGQTNFSGLTNLLTNPAALSDLTLAAASSGTITLPGGITLPSQAVLLSALSRVSNVNVLSSPTILTTDNQEAEIIVGENVPFVTSTSTDPTNLNNTFNQIERQDVGITLRITPQISTGDFVTLNIFVEISNVVPGTRNDPNGPTTTIRTTETTVEVKHSQMIVTGGLISDNVTVSTRGVPYFQDIPFLGNFFKREDEVQRRTNLLVFITPKILSDQFDAREETVTSRDILGSALQHQDVGPTRSEVLFNNNIDRVVPTVTGDVVKPPTTITPPPDETAFDSDDVADAVARTQRRLKELSLQNPDNSKPPPSAIKEEDDEEDVLDFTVKPKLPSARLGIEQPTAAPPVGSRAPTGDNGLKS